MSFTESIERIAPAGAKTESTYGSDASVSGSADGFLVIDSPILWRPDFEHKEYRPHGSTYTHPKDTIGLQLMNIMFKFLVQGSGTAGTVVQGADAVIQGAGLTKTVVPSTSVTYAMAAIGAHKSFTFKGEHNGFVANVLGCIGNLVLSGAVGEPLQAEFTGQGLYSAPTMGTLASWSPGATGAMRARTLKNISFAINNGTDNWTGPTGLNLRIDLGFNIGKIKDFNQATGLKKLSRRDQSPTFRCELILDTDTAGTIIQANEFLSDWANSVTHDVSFALNGGAGNINTFTVNDAQLIKVDFGSDGEGNRTIILDYKMQNDVAQAEFSWAQT